MPFLYRFEIRIFSCDLGSWWLNFYSRRGNSEPMKACWRLAMDETKLIALREKYSDKKVLESESRLKRRYLTQVWQRCLICRFSRRLMI